MSACVRCDFCGVVRPAGADELDDWIHIQWRLNDRPRITADVCTAACGMALIERASEEDAAMAMALLDEEDE